MKSFYDLPVLSADPALGLVIEDGVPDFVDMSGYKGLRGLSQVLSLATQAAEIQQIAGMAAIVGGQRIRVLRVHPEACRSKVMDQGSFPSLAEAGVTLFAISGTNKDFQDFPQEIAKKFALLSALEVSDRRWAILSAFKIAAAQAGLDTTPPEMLRPSPELLTVCPEWWGCGMPASTQQAMGLVGRVVDSCTTWQNMRQTLMAAESWLVRHESGFDSFEQLETAFRAVVSEIASAADLDSCCKT